MKKQKTKILITLSLWVILMMGMVTSVYASGTVIVAVSNSNLNIGDSVTVTATPKDPSGNNATATLTFTFDSSMFTFVSCSAGAGNYGGGAGGTVTVSAAMESVSITLKAKAAGSNTVTVSGADGVSTNLEDLGALSAGGAKITVANAASQDTNAATAAGGSATVSSDSSLSSLKISPGTLSPAFKSSTKSYTANVAEDITSIAVNATPANANATVTSVTGKDNLALGKNTVKIVVKAQNGTTSTYTIEVTRGATTDETTTAAQVATSITVDVNGTQMGVVSDLNSVTLPEGFVLSDYTYKGTTIQVARDEAKGLLLFYLTNPSTNESSFYIYDEQQDIFYKYQTLTVGSSTYIMMLADDTIAIPNGYKRTTLTIGEQQIEGWISDKDQEYGLLYAMGATGVKSLYLYNFEENSILKVNDKLLASLNSKGVDDLKTLNTQLKNSLNTRTWIGLIVIACLTILCIIFIILLVRKRNKLNYDQEELEEYMIEYATSSDQIDDHMLYEEEEEEEHVKSSINPEKDNQEEVLKEKFKEKLSTNKFSTPEESPIETSEKTKVDKSQIPDDVITEEKLKEFTKKCENIIGGDLSEFEEMEEGMNEEESLSLLDDDFEILDSDDDK